MPQEIFCKSIKQQGDIPRLGLVRGEPYTPPLVAQTKFKNHSGSNFYYTRLPLFWKQKMATVTLRRAHVS